MITRMTAAAWWDTCPGQRSSAPSVAKKESGKKHPLSWSVGKVQRMPHLSSHRVRIPTAVCHPCDPPAVQP